MAKRDIKPGEELSYDYDTGYFRAFTAPKGCMCSKCFADEQ
jgi:SET domain-containing protein